MKRISIGIVGDFDAGMHTHLALNDAMEHCLPHLPFPVSYTWVRTKNTEILFKREAFQGIWIAPGSPYSRDEAVFDAISWARQTDFPILGTCGGFQYMVIEYARNVLGLIDVTHGETDPHGEHVLISALACSLKGQTEMVNVPDADSWLRMATGKRRFLGHYFCSYGLRKEDRERVEKGALRFTAFSEDGEPRALELIGHTFFNGTLFQPSLDSTAENPNVLITDFLMQCERIAQGR